MEKNTVYYDAKRKEFDTISRDDIDPQEMNKYVLFCPVYKHTPFNYNYGKHETLSVKNGYSLIRELIEDGTTDSYEGLLTEDKTQFNFDKLLDTNLGFVIGCLGGFYNYITLTFDVPHKYVSLFDQLCYYTNTDIIDEDDENDKYIRYKCKIEQEFYVREFLDSNAVNFKRFRYVINENNDVEQLNELHIPSIPTTMNKHTEMNLGKVHTNDTLKTKILRGNLLMIPFNEVEEYDFVEISKYTTTDNNGNVFVAGDLVKKFAQ